MNRDVDLIDTRRDPEWDENVDEGGRWITFCNRHGLFIQHETRALARGWKDHPEDWCEGCSKEAE